MKRLIIAICFASASAFAEAPAHFATTYVTDAAHKGRASNIELAASAIDGQKIVPGATFSFNDAVGERTAAFGYARAVVLRDGMIAEGAGGGACQVASTLHAAALLAGLEVVARAPHTRPSAYIRMGFDATVAFPRIDLKLKNTFSEIVTVRAHAANGTVDVTLESATHPHVTLTSEIIERLPFTRVVEHDSALQDDAMHVKAFGIPGYRVRRVRDVDGKRDVRVDTYPPTNEVVRVRTDDATERVVDPGVVRPVLVQLRPSDRVVLEATP